MFRKLITTTIIILLLSGCGKKWEKFWGQDMKPNNIYFRDHGYAKEFIVPPGTDTMRLLILEIKDAPFLNVKIVNQGAFLELPVQVPGTDKTVDYIQDRVMLTVFNLSHISAEKVRVEWVLE